LQPIIVKNFLPDDSFQKIRSFVNSVNFIDGKRTAKGLARNKKNNLQAKLQTSKEQLMLSNIKLILLKTPIFKDYIFARQLSSLIINNYETGMYYDEHIDSAFMQGIRADFSFTFFLSDPNDYEGGELEIKLDDKNISIKPESNSIIIYESLNIHKVKEVLKGKRVSIVGWVESFIDTAEKRSVLRDIINFYNKISPNISEDDNQRLNIIIQKFYRLLSI
tara:strand:- start:377 stop:1036 length:660 start_codon:yes stop_codon:yes gene_type:complete